VGAFSERAGGPGFSGGRPPAGDVGESGRDGVAPQLAPRLVGAGQFAHVGEAEGAERGGGDRGADTGLAVDHQRPVARQVVVDEGEAADVALHGAGDGAGVVLALGAHVEQEGVGDVVDSVGRHTRRRAGGEAVERGDVADHLVDARPREPVADPIGVSGVAGEDDQATRVDLRRDGVAGVGRELLALGREVGAGDVVGADRLGAAGVDQDEVVAQPVAQPGGREGRQRGALAEDGRARLVGSLHAAEVERRVGLALEQRLDEAFLVAGLHQRRPPAGELLVADGGARYGAERLAAGAARAMAGPHLDVVGQREEAVAQAGEEPLGAFEAGVDAAGGLVEQVGPADVADEDEVAGEVEAGLLAGGAVGHQERQVLGGMPRRVDGLEPHVAELDDVAVLQQRALEAVLPVRVALVRQVELGARARRELARTGLVIGVDVGLGDGGDAQAVVGGEREVGVGVAARVDHDGLPGRLAADQVAGLGQVLVVDVLEEHVVLPSLGRG
jgi:hypothetical protein